MVAFQPKHAPNDNDHHNIDKSTSGILACTHKITGIITVTNGILSRIIEINQDIHKINIDKINKSVVEFTIHKLKLFNNHVFTTHSTIINNHAKKNKVDHSAELKDS